MLCLFCRSSRGKGRCHCLELAPGKGSRTGWSLVKPGICRAAPARQRLFLQLIQQWPNCWKGECSVVSAWRQQSCRGRAQLHPPESHQIFSCAQEQLFLREALEGRGSSDHKLQTPWLSWQLHHKICFLTFSQAPSWNFSDFLSLLFLLGPEPLRRTDIFSNFCPRCNQFISILFSSVSNYQKPK